MKLELERLVTSPMQLIHLDDVMAIELSVYTHPWSKGNFVDSLALGYDAWVVCAADGVLMGYFVQMPVVDEAHLLTIAVKETMQGQGVGTFLLQFLTSRAKAMQMESVSLEVRVSNGRAIAVYESFGFTLVGRRKNYYQCKDGQREDALIWRYAV